VATPDGAPQRGRSNRAGNDRSGELELLEIAGLGRAADRASVSTAGHRRDNPHAMAAPSPSLYHRWISSRAPALRRLAIDGAILVIVALVAAPFVPWTLAVLIGWNASALAFLARVLPEIGRADGVRTHQRAMREDETRDTARLLVLGSCGASLVAVVFALSVAKHETGDRRLLLVTVAVMTVALSWTVLNSVFTLRYADLFFRSSRPTIDFGQGDDEPPAYRDFAYLAFTIGMTYQVSDTALHDRGLRRTVLWHALVSYLFGVVIVATAVNVVAGLVA
jgi:uncharacterized membrane protein